MAKVGINTGSAANAGDGSALRAGANIINANFDEIYEYFGDGTTLDADLAGKWLAVATGINTLSNIGIGTTNPWNALTVLGNASITGVTTSSGGFSGDITGTLTGNVYNTGISTFQDVLVSGASTITGKSTFTGIGTFSSDLYVGGNLYTLGDVTYDEVNGRNISVTGIGTIAYLGATDLNVSGFSTFSGLSTTGSDLYIGDSLYVSQDATILGVTTSTGGVVLPDSVELKFGNLSGGDAKIYHNGTDTKFSNSTGQLEVISDDLEIRSSTGVQTYIKGAARAGSSAGAYVEIHGDVDFKTGIATFSQGATFSDGVELKFGNLSGGDAKIYHNGTDTKFSNSTGQLEIISDDLEIRSSTGVQTYIKGVSRTGSSAGASVEIHGDVDFKTGIATFSQDATFVGAASSNATWDKSANSLKFDDHAKASFGDSGDLTIHHDGADSRITQTSGSVGNLMITNSRADEQGGIYLQGKTGETGISVHPNSHVNLYFNDSLKLQTSGIGVTVTGGITCTGAGSTSTFEGNIDLTGNNNFVNLPSLTTTERTNATTMRAGSLIYNETLGRLEYYNGSAWKAVNNSNV